MSQDTFVDLYELLQVSPNAAGETISRVFRHLAKRFHPDNPQTGDRARFDQLVDAHRVLTDDERRAAYDLKYEEANVQSLGLAREVVTSGEYEDDIVLRERLLSVLYVQRRRDIAAAAMGEVHLEKVLGCPRELLEFHLWYLREKGFVERTDRGFAITVSGIDHAEASRSRLRSDRLITEEAAHAERPLRAVTSRVDGDDA